MMKLTDTEKREREEISRLVLRAKTMDDINIARQRLRSWLKRHPDDAQLLGEGESLVMLESAIQITQRNPSTSTR